MAQPNIGNMRYFGGFGYDLLCHNGHWSRNHSVASPFSTMSLIERFGPKRVCHVCGDQIIVDITEKPEHPEIPIDPILKEIWTRRGFYSK